MKSKLISAKANILVGEFIGKNIKITNSPRPELIGLEGEVLDETMKTFLIKTSKKEIKITKSGNEFDFDGIKINGKDIEFRPHERLKKYWRKV